jgi:hypothetical protein
LTRSFAPNTRAQAGMASIGALAVAVLRKLRLEIPTEEESPAEFSDTSSGGSMNSPVFLVIGNRLP